MGEAIEYATQYLDVYQSDADAWAELAELYTILGVHDKSTFSWAEAVLLKPFDQSLHASYADSIYAQALESSNEASYHLALKYYLRSVELCKDFLRGFCGIKVCCDAILEKSTASNTTRTLSREKGEAEPYMISDAKIRALDVMCTQVLSRLSRDLETTSKETAVAIDFAKSLIKSSTTVVR